MAACGYHDEEKESQKKNINIESIMPDCESYDEKDMRDSKLNIENMMLECENSDQKLPNKIPKVDVIFCGNPGVGKSTLLSCISGVQFESGVSFISGKTQELNFQWSERFPGFRFADTPGLTDITNCVEAAKQITKAFESARSSGRNVMIVFVLIAHGGRVRLEDLWTIRNVMDAIKIDGRKDETDNLYSVILNSCDFMKSDKLSKKGMNEIRAYFCARSANVPYTTSLVYFLPVIDKLAGAENATLDMPELTKFLMGCAFGKIKKVSPIKVGNLEKQLNDMKNSQTETENQVAALIADKHKLEKLLAELNAAHGERMRENPLHFVLLTLAKVVIKLIF